MKVEEKRFLKISEFAHIVGVTPATLRNWEDKGILKPHHILPNGYRYYTQAQADSLLNAEVNIESE